MTKKEAIVQRRWQMHLLGKEVLTELVCKDGFIKKHLPMLHNNHPKCGVRTVTYYLSWLYLVGWAQLSFALAAICWCCNVQGGFFSHRFG